MSFVDPVRSPKLAKGKFRAKKKKPKKASTINCGFRRHSRTIPPIIEQTCLYLEQHALQHEGLFRISGSQEGIRAIKDKFEKGKKVDLTKELNPNTIAGVLKLFFTELTNPIMTYELYPALISAISVEESHLRVWCLRQVMDVMPPGNREVIRRITAMFRTISGYESINKMSARNIALVMNPSLFRDPEGSMRDFVRNGGIRVRLVECFITQHNDIFLIPREQLDENIRQMGEISPATELHLLDFSQTLKQNAILLATALMSEGETEMAVCFDNFCNMHKSIDSWRSPAQQRSDRVFSRQQSEGVPTLRSRARASTECPIVSIDKIESSIPEPQIVLRRNRSTSRPPEPYLKPEPLLNPEPSPIPELSPERELQSPQLEDSPKTEKSHKPTKSSEPQIALRSRTKIKKMKRNYKREGSGAYKYSAPEVGRYSSDNPLNPDPEHDIENDAEHESSRDIITPRSSVRLFFDARDTNDIANEANVDISTLFQHVIEGNPDAINDSLASVELETRFLLIFRLQRAARDFILALDECK